MLRKEPFDIYSKNPGLSQSQLKYLLKCPALFKHHVLDGNNNFDSEAMKTGRMLHKSILEPKDFDKEFYITEKIRRAGKAWEEIQGIAGDRDIIFNEDMGAIKAMCQQVFKHDYASRLLDGSNNEVSVYWDHPNGIKCKARLDAIKQVNDDVILIDLKTARSISEYSFMNAIFSYGYHIQAAFYMDAYFAATGIMPKYFVIIAIDKTAPHLVAVYILKNDSAAMEFGRQEYERLLDIYLECTANGKWEDAYNEPYAVYIPPVFLK